LFTDGLAVRQYLPAAIFAGAGRLAAAQQGLCSTGGTVNDTTDEAAAVKNFPGPRRRRSIFLSLFNPIFFTSFVGVAGSALWTTQFLFALFRRA
jgi:hypothetical protein